MWCKPAAGGAHDGSSGDDRAGCSGTDRRAETDYCTDCRGFGGQHHTGAAAQADDACSGYGWRSHDR